MKRVLLWVVDYPVTTVLVVLAATVWFGLQLPRLRIDESVEGMMVKRDPARAFHELAKERFGNDDLTVVVVKASDVFTTDALRLVRRLSEALKRIDGVSRVESLTTVKNIKGEADQLDTEPLVGGTVPTAPEDLARVRRDALGNRVFVGNIVAADARATAITVYTDPKPGDTGFNKRFVQAVEALLQREAMPGVVLYQVGSPFTKVEYTRYVAADLRTVIPIGTALLFLTLLLAFRTPQGVVIPLVTAGLSVVWGMGLMAALGIPLTILTAIVPSLVIGIGFTEDVHMITEYHHRLASGDDKLTAIRRIVVDGALPLTVTTATTVLGFGSLITTDIPMLQQFGVASAMALSANFVVTVLLLPVMLRWWPVPRWIRRATHAGTGDGGLIPRLMERLGHFNLRYRVPILVVTGVITAASLVGWYRLDVNTDVVSFFPERSEVRQRIADLHASLGGALNFSIVVDTGRKDGAKDPAVLRKVAEIQDFLAGTGKVDKTVSLADYIRMMHREMNSGDPAFEVIPDSVELIHQYFLMLEGKELAKFVDFDGAAVNIVVRHNLTGSADLSALLRQLDGFLAGRVPPTLIVRPTGEAILFNNASDYMAVNELSSFAFTFIVIGLIHSVLFMSVRAGALSLIPNLVPILCVYGLMGAIGIPLNTTTATIGSIAIGIAVDDTVHHMVMYHRQLRIHHDQRLAMFETMKVQGRPIIYVSLALAAGFLPPAFSSFAPSVHWSLLAALAMLLAMVGELVLTPILMYSIRLVTLWDVVMLKMNRDLVRTAPLFRGLSQWEARKVVLLGQIRAAAPGELVIRKGDRGTEMYLLVTGRAKVADHSTDGTETVLTVLEPGDVFGEMGLVSGEVRSADVAAETPVEVLRLDAEALERLRRRFPYTSAKIFRNLAYVLSDRLRQSTRNVVAGRLQVAPPPDALRPALP